MTLVTRPNDPAAHPSPVEGVIVAIGSRSKAAGPAEPTISSRATEPEATVATEPFLGMVGFRGNSGAVLLSQTRNGMKSCSATNIFKRWFTT
jgi:mannose-6-phosphate isomerase class I